MEPLKLNRQWLAWLCLCAPDKNTSPTMRSFYSIFPVIVLVGDLVGLAAGTAFFLKIISSDLESGLYSLCQMAGMADMAYMMILSFFLREKFTATVDSLMKMYRESECSRYRNG